MIFADIVAELKTQHPIYLEAAIPYQKRMKTPDRDFQRLIHCCDVVKIHSVGYSKDCYMKRTDIWLSSLRWLLPFRMVENMAVQQQL